MQQDLKTLVGQILAERYRIDSLIGIGGMGAVFRGLHLTLRREVAIKVLRPDLLRNKEVSARFDREAHSASRLDHPNCLHVTDYGTSSGGLRYLVMQLLEGEELKTLLDRGEVGMARAVDICAQMLRGLDHAHRRGVVHRDIKPENVVVGRDDDGGDLVRIVDFGIAKIAEETEPDAFTTRVGLIFGTPAYMSPEQAAGLSADARSDVYSCGILFYQALCGRPPFTEDDPLALIRRHLTSRPPPLPSMIPPVLTAVVEQMLTKDRDQRFQSAAAALSALEQAAAMVWPQGRPGSELRGTGTDLPRMDSRPSVRGRAPGVPQRIDSAPGIHVQSIAEHQRRETGEVMRGVTPDWSTDADLEYSLRTGASPLPTSAKNNRQPVGRRSRTAPSVSDELVAFEKALQRALRDPSALTGEDLVPVGEAEEVETASSSSSDRYHIDLDNLELEELDPSRYDE